MLSNCDRWWCRNCKLFIGFSRFCQSVGNHGNGILRIAGKRDTSCVLWDTRMDKHSVLWKICILMPVIRMRGCNSLWGEPYRLWALPLCEKKAVVTHNLQTLQEKVYEPMKMKTQERGQGSVIIKALPPLDEQDPLWYWIPCQIILIDFWYSALLTIEVCCSWVGWQNLCVETAGGVEAVESAGPGEVLFLSPRHTRSPRRLGDSSRLTSTRTVLSAVTAAPCSVSADGIHTSVSCIRKWDR